MKFPRHGTSKFANIEYLHRCIFLGQHPAFVAVLQCHPVTNTVIQSSKSGADSLSPIHNNINNGLVSHPDDWGASSCWCKTWPMWRAPQRRGTRHTVVNGCERYRYEVVFLSHTTGCNYVAVSHHHFFREYGAESPWNGNGAVNTWQFVHSISESFRHLFSNLSALEVVKIMQSMHNPNQ